MIYDWNITGKLSLHRFYQGKTMSEPQFPVENPLPTISLTTIPDSPSSSTYDSGLDISYGFSPAASHTSLESMAASQQLSQAETPETTRSNSLDLSLCRDVSTSPFVSSSPAASQGKNDSWVPPQQSYAQVQYVGGASYSDVTPYWDLTNAPWWMEAPGMGYQPELTHSYHHQPPPPMYESPQLHMVPPPIDPSTQTPSMATGPFTSDQACAMWAAIGLPTISPAQYR